MWEMARRSLGRYGPQSGALNPKRLLLLLAFFGFFPLIQMFHMVCFFLDELFYPEYDAVDLKPPLFIVGNPRSGTTFLHRLMAEDGNGFFCFHAWEIMFPAIVQKKILGWLGRADRCLGSPFKRSILFLESRILKPLDTMHRTGLFQPEEDEMLLIHMFSSFIYLVWLFPYPGWQDLMRFDERLDDRSKQRIMLFYRQCVKRQAYWAGEGRRLLSKNPGFTPKLRTLLEYFPDCRIVYLVRNPLDAIGSMQSMATELWKATLGSAPNSELQLQLYDMAKYYYEYPLDTFAEWPQERFYIASYNDLTERPGDVVAAIYRHFGMPITEQLEAILHAANQMAGTHKSRHQYSLDDFVVPEDQIKIDLKKVFDRFGFGHNISMPS